MIMHRCRAFKDFWDTHVATYTYVNLDRHLHANIKDSSTTDTFINDNDSISVRNFTIANDTLDINSALDKNTSIDSLHNKDIKSIESIQSYPIRSEKIVESTLNTKAITTSLYHALKQPYITLAQLHKNHAKPHSLANILYHKESTRIYYSVLPLDYLISAQIDIEKSTLQQANMLDSIVALQAKDKGLIPHNCECRYFLQQRTKTHYSFQIFCVKDKILRDYALRYAGKVLYLNPLEMCCGIFTFYPHLTRYTVIFQDIKKHAICHYIHGVLTVSVLLDRNEALQNYYGLIENFGEIFYCDFSGKPDLLKDFRDISTLFDIQLKDCLHILALSHIRTKPVYVNFYARAFYSMRTKVKVMLSVAICIFIAYFLNLFYHKYEYHRFLQSEALIHSKQIDSLYHKKQQYPLIYERIYTHLLETQNLHFCLQQDYNDTESIWIQTHCKD